MQDLVLVLDMGKSTKQVGKYVGKLKEAGLISMWVHLGGLVDPD